MAETQAHLALVRRIVQYAEWRLRAQSAIAIYSDLPSTPRSDKPPRIGGFVPDVLATDVPTTFHLLGEAKTLSDLEQVHTVRQLKAFLGHLSVRGGILVVAVPWAATPAARRLVREAAVEMRAQRVERVVIDDVNLWD